MFWLRAFAVWVVIIVVESIHGTLRTLFLAPYVGDFRARQIAVFIASLLILFVAWLCVRWLVGPQVGPLVSSMRPVSQVSLLRAGLLWLALTLAFEFGAGHYAFGRSWHDLASDYDLAHGGLLPIGMVVLVLAPLIAARLRRIPLRWQ